MFDRLFYGWELAKDSFNVLRLDKELLVFPLCSGICCLLVLASFGVPLWGSEYAGLIFNDHQVPHDPVAYAILFAFYFVNYFVIVFFNSALVACAVIRFRGDDPTVMDGFRAAFSRLPQILGWALVSATVGILLKVIESRSKNAGRIAAALLGAGWTFATFFVVPVLVVERANPVTAVKRSLSILTKAWGESIGAHFGIGMIVTLATLVCVLPMFGGGYFISAGHMVPGIALIACGFAGLLLVSLISSALDSILLAALYLYAAEGSAPDYFDHRLLRQSFAAPDEE